MTFGAPLFLIAILAGIIPVLLHMINRQKAPVLPFSTLRFLRLSVERTRRRKYIHDMLLLLLRVVVLLLIAVGLAQPTLSRLGSLLGGSASSAVVLVLDNSASMGTRDQHGARWESALRASEQLLDHLRDGDSVALLVTCGPPRPEMQRLYTNHEVVRQALDACQLSFERADLAAKLQIARKLLQNAPAPNKEIYVVTDMQAIAWNALQRENENGLQEDGPQQSASEVPVVLVDVHGERLPNVGLRRVELQSAVPVAGVPRQATVELVGDVRIAQQRHVELHLDGKKLDVSPTLSLEAGGTAEHTFSFPVDEPGLHRGEVRLVGSDACPMDDRLFFAINVDPHIPVAVVKPESHQIAYLEDTYYLERALMPLRAGRWAIRVTSLTPTGLAAEPLANYAVLFCVNLPAPQQAVAQQLQQYVRRGGHLVWICGENVDPILYSAMNEQVGGDLLPLRLTGVRRPTPDGPDSWRVGGLDAQHPVLQPLAEPASLYQSVLVYQHVQVAPLQGSGARVLARLEDGAPWLLERSVEQGSVLLLTSSVHVDWSNLPLRPFFLPLVSRLTFHLAGADATQPQVIAGSPLIVPLQEDDSKMVEITRPSGELVRVERTEEGEPIIGYADTHEVGIYQVRLRDGVRSREIGYASNLDPEESAPATLPRESLQQRLGPTQPLVFCEDPRDLTATIGQLRQGESLWELFLILVLVGLVVESYVANRRVSKQEQRPVRQVQTNRPRAVSAGQTRPGFDLLEQPTVER